MQAAKIRAPRSIEAYTGNLAMKVQVSYVPCRVRCQLMFKAKLGGVTHQVPIKDLPGMVKGKTMLLGGNLGFVSYCSTAPGGIQLIPATHPLWPI
jgi:eukaryotic translation initiation factor 2C